MSSPTVDPAAAALIALITEYWQDQWRPCPLHILQRMARPALRAHLSAPANTAILRTLLAPHVRHGQHNPDGILFVIANRTGGRSYLPTSALDEGGANRVLNLETIRTWRGYNSHDQTPVAPSELELEIMTRQATDFVAPSLAPAKPQPWLTQAGKKPLPAPAPAPASTSPLPANPPPALVVPGTQATVTLATKSDPAATPLDFGPAQL